MTNTNEARIETSTLCNYNCSFCPHDKLSRTKEIMSFELFKEILSKLPETIEYLTLSGLGEMFLDKNIYEKIKYAKSLGYKVNALSNASRLDYKKVIESGIDSIRISFHSSDIEKYINITNSSKKDYNNALDNIYKLIESNIKTIITVDVVKKDEADINKIISMFKKADLLEIWYVHNWGNEFDYRKGSKKKLTCGRPFNGPLQIQVDGTINMCCFDYDGKLTLGDLKTDKLEDIFKSYIYKEIVNYHTGKGSHLDLLCKNCDQLYEKDDSILIYNSLYGKERIGKLSTTYKEM